MPVTAEMTLVETEYACLMPTNIYLIGPMGVGKTTIGRLLSKQLRMGFLDSDREIEKRTGASVSLIFDIEGEEGFRDRESKMLQELSRHENVVVATGGGAILREENRQALRSSGIVVYLHGSVDLQYERTRHSKSRPLLEKGLRRETLEALMKVREPLYRQEADIIVNTEEQSAVSVVRDIVRRMEQL